MDSCKQPFNIDCVFFYPPTCKDMFFEYETCYVQEYIETWMKLKNAQSKLAREPAITRRSHLVIAILLVTFLLKEK